MLSEVAKGGYSVHVNFPPAVSSCGLLVCNSIVIMTRRKNELCKRMEHKDTYSPDGTGARTRDQ